MIPLVNDNSPDAINTSLIAVKREIQTLNAGAKNNSNGSGVDVTTELTESINGLKIAVDGLTETLTPGEETSFSCASAANAEYKEVDIGTADFSNLKEIAVIMTNGNTYGETTIATPTNPKLRVKNGDSILFELAICDCKGHVAGKGFCNAGDIIIFKHVSGKALVTNSDIRESSTSATSEYTIYADGRIREFGYTSTENSNGRAAISVSRFSKITYIGSTLVKNNNTAVNNRWLEYASKSGDYLLFYGGYISGADSGPGAVNFYFEIIGYI